MKARTKREKLILEMSKELKPIGERERKWAFKNLFKGIGLYRRGVVWCLCCGHHFDHQMQEDGKKKMKCPKCGHGILIKESHRKLREHVEESLFVVMQEHKGFQVFRAMVVRRYNRINEDTVFEICEVYQNWLDEKGKETIVGKPYHRGSFYFKWRYEDDFVIQKHNGGSNGGYFVYEDVFDCGQGFYYPRIFLSPTLKRNGFTDVLFKVKGINILSVAKKLLEDSFAEELVKHGQLEVLEYWMNAGGRNADKSQWRHAIRICERNKYHVKDASLWFDYLAMLTDEGLDTRNSHYVCPKDLKKAHDELLMRLNKRKIIQIEEAHEREYKRRFGKFFGIRIGNENINIEPLKSIKEFMFEAEHLRHCVFKMEYYNEEKHPNSLILSAKDKKGNRIETIEVNTRTWMVNQSRGKHNLLTKYHDEIVSLVESNIQLFKSLA